MSGRTAKAIAFAMLAGALTYAAAACGKRASAVGAGEECSLATDCQPGLVCVPQRDGSRVCSSDLSRVTGDPPPDQGPDEPGDPEDGSADGAPAPDGGAESGPDPQDAGDEG